MNRHGEQGEPAGSGARGRWELLDLPAAMGVMIGAGAREYGGEQEHHPGLGDGDGPCGGHSSGTTASMPRA